MRRALPLLLAGLGCAPGKLPSGGPEDSARGETGAETSLPDSAPAEDSDSAAPDEDATIEQIPASEAGQALFSDTDVHELSLSLDEEARASLLSAPKTYVEGLFSDGERSLVVGVRLKGSTSFQPLTGKPNLRISFDHYVDEQRYDGLEAVDLISEVEDPAAMSEAIAYRIFRQAGQPASRTGFAHLSIDDADYGLYTLVEKKDDVLIRRWWPDDHDGSLYESSTEYWPCDLDDGGSPRCDCWEQDEQGEDSREDLEALCAVATDSADADWYAEITEATGWQEIVGHMATEILIDAHDHYAGYMGNVYLYHAPEAGEWALLPASMNSAFGSTRYVAGSCGGSGRVPTSFNGGLLIRRCWADEACTEQLYEALGEAVDALRGSDVLDQIDAWEALLEPYAVSDPKRGYSADAYTLQVQCIRDWLADRPAALQPWLPVSCLGEGGVLDVDGYGDLSTNGSCDRDYPDIVSFSVLSLDGARVGLGEAPDGLEVGDEVLLIAAQGEDEVEPVGTFAFAEVASVSSAGLVLTADPELGVDPASVRLVIQRVPHYSAVTVRAGAVLTAGAWSGETGGALAMRVSGALVIEDGGTLTVGGLGYTGGSTGSSYNIDGYQGESLLGAGIGGASSGAGYNESIGAWAANLGGGGCNVGGGGGEHAGGATGADSWNGVATAPEPGETYGEEDLSALLFGSGGGGVVNLYGSSGAGAAGGGVLYVEAGSVEAPGAAALVASGDDATSWASGSWTYGAGGGAGGSLWIVADTLVLGEDAVLARGGLGYAAVTRPGGDGGEGRVRLDCETVNGRSCTAAALSGLVDPAPWLGTP